MTITPEFVHACRAVFNFALSSHNDERTYLSREPRAHNVRQELPNILLFSWWHGEAARLNDRYQADMPAAKSISLWPLGDHHVSFDISNKKIVLLDSTIDP